MPIVNNGESYETPVCLIVFKRPDLTRRLLNILRMVRPRSLFIVADGPRADRPEDKAACLQVRREIERIDWPCDIALNYSASNMGCGLRPASGISWLFDHVDEAVILEDDCLPHPSLFPFCSQLLERYRDDPRVMQISGSNYHRTELPMACSYFFSGSPGCWGWATWKRAWMHFDASAAAWPEAKKSGRLWNFMGYPHLVPEYTKALDHAYSTEGRCSYWDYQWGLACFLNEGLSIIPKYNMIRNDGFGDNATHTRNPESAESRMPVQAMQFPLLHPKQVAINHSMRKFYIRANMEKAPASSIPRRSLRRIARFLSKAVK